MSIQKNIPLAPFSSFAVGGNADFFASIREKRELCEALNFAQQNSIPVFFLGGGSNILFSDNGFRGIVLHFQNTKQEHNGGNIFALEAGVTNANFFRFAQKKEYDFSPFLTIPGTIGGAIAGNAGIPKYEIGALVQSAEIFDYKRGEFLRVHRDFFEFSYRHTRLQKERNLILWSVILQLPKKRKDEIESSAKAFVQRRKEKQPWGKTGGSFFKNPSEGAAGFFLDNVDMKGERMGGAFFSEKHANFIMNDGRATQKNILTIAEKGRNRVFQKHQIWLQNEVRIINEWGTDIFLKKS